MRSWGVMLTYNGATDQQQWKRFLEHTNAKRAQWKVKYWCATLEKCKNGKLHVYLYLQFTTVLHKYSKQFRLE